MIKKQLQFLSIILFLGLSSFFPKPIHAQGSSDGVGCGGGMGPVADFVCQLQAGSANQASNKLLVGTRLNQLLSFVIGFLTIIAGLWFAIQFILAGYQWISSSGDKGKLETAQKKLTYSILGLIIVVAAWVIVGFIGVLLGLDILNPGQIIQTFGI